MPQLSSSSVQARPIRIKGLIRIESDGCYALMPEPKCEDCYYDLVQHTKYFMYILHQHGELKNNDLRYYMLGTGSILIRAASSGRKFLIGIEAYLRSPGAHRGKLCGKFNSEMWYV